MKLSPEEFLNQAPADMRYIFARLDQFFFVTYDGDLQLGNTEFLEQHNNQLFFELNTRTDLPPRYRVLAELPLNSGTGVEDNRGFTRARLIEVLPTN